MQAVLQPCLLHARRPLSSGAALSRQTCSMASSQSRLATPAPIDSATGRSTADAITSQASTSQPVSLQPQQQQQRQQGGASAPPPERPLASAPLSAVVADAVHRWYQDTSREALKGDVKQQALLGQMLAEGYGCEPNPTTSKMWAEKARRRCYRMSGVYCEL